MRKDIITVTSPLLPDLNDFHAFKNTSGGDSGNSGGGCSTPFWIIIIVVAVTTLLGQCSN